MNILFIAKDSYHSLDFAIAFSVYVPGLWNMWLVLLPFLDFWIFQSHRSSSILSIFQFVNGVTFTVVGEVLLIESTFIKNVNHLLWFPRGVVSNLLSHNEITILLLSSTIQILFFLLSQSISSSHTFQAPSSSKSYWLGLYSYGQLSLQFSIQSQS